MLASNLCIYSWFCVKATPSVLEGVADGFMDLFLQLVGFLFPDPDLLKEVIVDPKWRGKS